MAFKDKYYTPEGDELLSVKAVFISSLGVNKSGGTKEKPLSTKSEINVGYGKSGILSGGYHNKITSFSLYPYVKGQGIFNTVIGTLDTQDTIGITFCDLTFTQVLKLFNINAPASFYNSQISSSFETNLSAGKIAIDKCIVHKEIDAKYIARSIILNVDNSDYLNALNNIPLTNCIFSNCTFNIPQLNQNTSNYLHFDNCKFKIGDEAEATELKGKTSDEKRANLVTRLEAKGINIPEITEGGVKGKLLKWTFFEDSIYAGKVIKNSELDKFQKSKGILMGRSDKTVNPIHITRETNKINSINDIFASRGLTIVDNHIQIKDGIDITKLDTYTMQSGIIDLGAKVELDEIDIVEDFLVEYGIMADSSRAISETPTTLIESEKIYHISSEDGSLASVKYDGAVYTSDSTLPTNVFRGVKDITTFEVLDNSKPLVKEVLDIALQRTVDIRLVDELPAEKIRSGNLLTEFWYMVAYDDASVIDKGYVTYKGVKYPCRSSFLVDASDLAFSIPAEFANKVHLRRFCHKDHDAKTNNVDTNFWKGKQSPIPMSVVYDDLRAQYLNNSEASGIVALDKNGIPKTSGHPDFYDEVSTRGGIPAPSFKLAGKYLQIILKVSTQNGY